MQRIDQQNQERARHRADDRPEERDDVGHADHRRHQHRIRQPEDEHSEVAQKADDERVDDLADHEAVEDLVRLAAKVEQMVCRRGPEHRDDQLLGLRLKNILRPEHVDRRHKADEQIRHALDDRDHGRGQRGQELLHVAQQARADPVAQEVVDLVEAHFHIILDLRVVVEQIVDPFLNASVIGLGVVDDTRHAVIQLRQQHGEKRIHDKSGNDQREHDARRAAELLRRIACLRILCLFLFQRGCQPRIDEFHERIEQEREHDAVDQRRQNRPEAVQHGKEARNVRKDHDQQDADDDDDQGGDPPAEIRLVPVRTVRVVFHMLSSHCFSFKRNTGNQDLQENACFLYNVFTFSRKRRISAA